MELFHLLMHFYDKLGSTHASRRWTHVTKIVCVYSIRRLVCASDRFVRSSWNKSILNLAHIE